MTSATMLIVAALVFVVVARAASSSAGSSSDGTGELPDAVTPWDDQYPGVANLDFDLLDALRDAARDASASGVTLYVNSGWRSAGYQRALFREAVSTYGSEAEASRWVASPHSSAHVTGDAVDIGPAGAAAWLAEHGLRYGLCQIYGNEPWHFELRPEASDAGCPEPHPDAASLAAMHR